MPRQVRLDDDVVTALERLVDAQGEGSIASHANRRLRQALGLTTSTKGEPAAGSTVSSAAGRLGRRGPLGARARTDDAGLRSRLGAS